MTAEDATSGLCGTVLESAAEHGESEKRDGNRTARRIRGEVRGSQMNAQVRGWLASFCKTVGFAYTGSNPVPATAPRTAPDLHKQVRGRCH
ncbi:hypothetical protein GCM10023317_60200 [Actinopolymorpha pittospori]